MSIRYTPNIMRFITGQERWQEKLIDLNDVVAVDELQVFLRGGGIIPLSGDNLSQLKEAWIALSSPKSALRTNTAGNAALPPPPSHNFMLAVRLPNESQSAYLERLLGMLNNLPHTTLYESPDPNFAPKLATFALPSRILYTGNVRFVKLDATARAGKMHLFVNTYDEYGTLDPEHSDHFGDGYSVALAYFISECHRFLNLFGLGDRVTDHD